ncbi:MAG: toll/interleukin-1 receptor domain-containing protein, partial [Clostridia bacterium]|nr:toll/interleukin-1 receptor domain-containing protein [Clostridia bacterium]
MSEKKKFKDHPIGKFLSEKGLDAFSILWQAKEWYNETIENALLDKSSINTLIAFYNAIQGSFGAERINYIINKYSVKEPEDKKDFFTKVAENLKKLFTSKEDLEKRNAAILLLCLYKNINLIENKPKDNDNEELIEFLLALHKVMQENIHIIFSLSDGKQALIYSTFFTSISFELQEIRKLIKAGVYKDKDDKLFIHLKDKECTCGKTDFELILDETKHDETKQGVIDVKVACKCGEMWRPEYTLEKGTDQLDANAVKGILETFANAIGEQLDKILETNTELRNIFQNFLDVEPHIESLKEEICKTYISQERLKSCCDYIILKDATNLFANAICKLSDKNQISETISDINKQIERYSEYLPWIVKYLAKMMESKDLSIASLFVENCFKYNYIDNGARIFFEDQKENISEGIYNLTVIREVFIAHSSLDNKIAENLVEELKRKNITYFWAVENLRKSNRTEEDYKKALCQAIDNCKSLVFVSSKNSRGLENDAVDIELSYVYKTYEKAGIHYKKQNGSMFYLFEYRINNGSESELLYDKTISEYFGTQSRYYDLGDLVWRITNKLHGLDKDETNGEPKIETIPAKPITSYPKVGQTPISRESDEKKSLDKKPSDSEKLETPKNSPIIPTSPTFIEQKKLKKAAILKLISNSLFVISGVFALIGLIIFLANLWDLDIFRFREWWLMLPFGISFISIVVSSILRRVSIHLHPLNKNLLKTIFRVVCSLVLGITSLLFSIQSVALYFEQDLSEGQVVHYYSSGWYYDLTDDSSAVVLVKPRKRLITSVNIPTKLGGKDVVGIGDSAFFCCRSLTSIE